MEKDDGTVNEKHRPEVVNRGRIGILIVTYNALGYVEKCIRSLSSNRPHNIEIVVYDNGSDAETKQFLRACESDGRIEKVFFSEVNHFFVKGNNEAAKLVSPTVEHFLLLNSDTEILDWGFIDLLVGLIPSGGIASLGAVKTPVLRPDGWCFLVDRKSFEKFGGMNEYYQMDWGITDLTSRMLRSGLPVSVILNPGRYVVHHGGKSYRGRRKSKKVFNRMSTKQVKELFSGQVVKALKID